MKLKSVKTLGVTVQFAGSFLCPLRSYPEGQSEGTQYPWFRFRLTHCTARLWSLDQHFTLY